jgi:hypothetical protein
MKKLNWHQLNAQLRAFSEEELRDMINAEMKGTQRLSVIKRLHQRYCIVRATRERAAILALDTSLEL